MPAEAHASKKILQTAARVALLGLLINVVLASVKIIAGVIGHAYVLIADGIESALDIGGNDALPYQEKQVRNAIREVTK